MSQVTDFVLSFVSAIGSSTDDANNGVKINMSGIGGLKESSDGIVEAAFESDEDGEISDDQAMFGMLGVVARPLDPEDIDGVNYRAEAIAMRTADGLIPLAWRDLRLSNVSPTGIPKGCVRVVGYGGSFHSIDSNIDGSSRLDTQTIYMPYDYVDGVPTKAHSIILQPTADDGIAITHADGYMISITSSGITMNTSDTGTFINMKEGEITLSAAKIYAKGTVYVGQQAEAGLPLLAGAVSPPCPSLFLSPV